ncbi:L-seryl-tRNA(Sec) selenium transferase [Naumannella halotolerans]|uniref:L-seryl-tRNA(Sec) selenium transferase n=1 Tax=Naumannella halotolerans TaxID=993414 RepID=UPI00370D84BB
MDQRDPRRRIPRTDELLALDELRSALDELGEAAVSALVRRTQQRARDGEITPEQVRQELLTELESLRVCSLRPVLNATGVIIHTNLGRAPLSPAAARAVAEASGYVDVELDLVSGARAQRGAGARRALLEACPVAEDALIVNNGAAALVLATTALASRAEVIISRGELIEIGAGFRLPDLIASTGARLHEVGTTNRTHPADYAEAIGPQTGCLLKVHPSNFRVQGFTSSVDLAELAPLTRQAGVPLIADLGSGLLTADPLLPEEPDATTALSAGAELVIASGDKLLGGPQAGILLGCKELIAQLARHPLARAVRADKLALAALEATLRGPQPPVRRALHADPRHLRERTAALAAQLEVPVLTHDGRVGGGGAPGHPLAGWALKLPVAAAPLLRTGEPAVLPRVHDDACLVDLRCVPEEDDQRLLLAVQTAIGNLPRN